MDCTNAQTLLDGYLDGEFDPPRNVEIEDHLHGCAHCAQSYNDRQVIRSGLKTNSFYFKAPADLQKRIQRAVRQAAIRPEEFAHVDWNRQLVQQPKRLRRHH